ncbi:hypothetical protein D3C78_786520 [compost metagenome]
MPNLTCTNRSVVLHLFAQSAPLVQIACPELVVALFLRIREYQLPVKVFLHCLHEGVADADGQIRIRDLAHRLLDCNEIKHIRVPVIDHEHERAASAATLLDQACRIAEQPSPGYCAAGGAIHAGHNRAMRPQGRKVHADAATTGHNFRHFLQRIHNAASAVLRRRNDIAVKQRQLLACSSSSRDSPARNELPILQNVSELILPFLLLLVAAFDGGHCSCQAVPHFLRRLLYGQRKLVYS